MRLAWPILAVLVATTASAGAEALVLEGDARQLTVVSENVARSAVVAAISDRLDIAVSGTPVAEGVVSGRFSGNLSHVLRAVLADNGFVITYDNGRASRIVVTGPASSRPARVPGMDPAWMDPPPESMPPFDPGNPNADQMLPQSDLF